MVHSYELTPPSVAVTPSHPTLHHTLFTAPNSLSASNMLREELLRAVPNRVLSEGTGAQAGVTTLMGQHHY